METRGRLPFSPRAPMKYECIVSSSVSSPCPPACLPQILTAGGEAGAVRTHADRGSYNDQPSTPVRGGLHCVCRYAMAMPRQRPRGPRNELHSAALRGFAERTTELLSTGSIDIDQGDPRGMTALMIAAMWGYLGVVSILLNKGADVALADDKGFTALHNSIQAGSVPVTKLLINAGADLEAKNLDGSTPLSVATEENRFEVMGVLLEAGANPNSRRPDEATPLHLAAFCGHLESIKVLLRGKANPMLSATMNTMSPIGNLVRPPRDSAVPLDIAAEYGRTDVVRALVQQVGIRGCGGASGGVIALRQATQEGHIGTMAALTDAGVVDPGLCLIAAAGCARVTSVRFLLQQQQRRQRSNARGRIAYVNSQDMSGTPPLIYAIGVASFSSLRVVRLLIDAGADTTLSVLLRNDRGMIVYDTPLTLATRYHREKKLNGYPATEAQLRALEATRRLLQRVEAIRATSWTWPSEVHPVASSSAAGGTTKPKTMKTSAALTAMLPILRRRTRKRVMIVAAVTRWVMNSGHGVHAYGVGCSSTCQVFGL